MPLGKCYSFLIWLGATALDFSMQVGFKVQNKLSISNEVLFKQYCKTEVPTIFERNVELISIYDVHPF